MVLLVVSMLLVVVLLVKNPRRGQLGILVSPIMVEVRLIASACLRRTGLLWLVESRNVSIGSLGVAL